MNYRNSKFNAFGTIDCEIEHPIYGWIPFHCDPNDKGAQFDTAELFGKMQPFATPYIPSPPPAPEEIAAELKQLYRAAIQGHIDAVAQSRLYDNGAALAGYINSTIPAWKAEAETFVAWRDQVWLFIFEYLAKVEAGLVGPPDNPAALIAELPQIVWSE